MSYHDRIGALSADAEGLEEVYRAARAAGAADAFKRAIDDVHEQSPDNLLYAAWFYRLREVAVKAKGHAVAWAWVLPLALLNGLLFWWLSGDHFRIPIQGLSAVDRYFGPAILLLGAPLSAAAMLVYLTVVGRRPWRLSVPIGLGLLAACAYARLTYQQAGSIPFQEQYLVLAAIHLPLLAWAGVGLFLVARRGDPLNRFCLLVKSLEFFILGGLFVIAGGLFTAITLALFQALNVDLPEVVQRLFYAGGLGLIPAVALAVIYNPAAAPAEQAFDEGLSKLVALLMRVLLPLSLLVLLVYLAFIPFNFWAPFANRDVLITYNVMLFAVVALLVGATPISQEGLSPRLARWLRWGIVAVAALALVVSLYALAAIAYRTAMDHLTPNRLAFLGWNAVNIGLLSLVLLLQARAREGQWLDRLHRAYRFGTVAYAAWTLFVIVAVPWFFGIDQGEVGALPRPVQRIVVEEPPPILLKCSASPHIYLLDGGEKRWIRDIGVFRDRGYQWQDVKFVGCDDLRSIPDGVPIPADAGPPPQP